MALNREKVVRNAEKYVSKGKLEAAIKEYRKVLKENPNDTNTLNRVGDLYARLERFDEAVRLFSQIAEKYTDDGFFVKAIAIYKKIIKFDPSSLSVYERLADLYHRQGLTNESRNQYQFLADYYLKNNNLTSATTIFQRMAEVEPDDPGHRLKLAELYEKQRFPDKAVREYQAIADIVLRADSPDEAVHVYNKALELAPDDLGLVRSAVKSLHDGGHMGAAAKVLAKAVDLNPAAQSVADELRLSAPEPEAAGADAAAEDEATAATKLSTPSAAADDPFAIPEESFDLDAAANEAMAAIDAAGDDDGFDDGIEAAADAAALDFDGDESAFEIQPPDDMGDGPGTGFGDDFEFEVELESDIELEMESEADLELEAEEEAEAEEEDEAPRHDTAPAMDVDFAGMDDDLAADLDAEPVEIGAEPADLDDIELEIDLEEPVAVEAPPAKATAAPEAAALEEVEADDEIADDATPVRREEDLLAEAKVFQKYGLAEKARDRLSELLEVNSEHLEGLRLLAAMELEAEDTESAEALAGRLAAAATEAGNAEFYDELRGDFAAQGLSLEALDVPSAAPAPETEELAEDETVISAVPDEPEPEPEPVAAEPEPESEQEEPEPELVEAALEPEPEPVAEAKEPSRPAKKGKSRDRIAQLLEDLSLDAFDAPTRKPKKAKVPEPEAEPAAPEPAVPEPAAPEPVAAEPEPEPASQPVAAEPEPAPEATEPEPEPAEPEPVVAAPAPAASGGMFSLKDELDLDDIVDPESDPEPVEASAAAGSGAQEDFDETGMSWLDAGEPETAAASAGGEGAQSGGQDLESLFDEEDDFFDLAAELEEELGADAVAQVDGGVSSMESQEGTLEEIIEGFKAGVAEHLSEEDYDTHFNLGIAYREMGLLDEAIGEFQVSSKDERYLAESASMLGMCFMEKGLPELAVRWYKKGLGAPEVTEDATLGLLYDLATSYESMGETESAYRTFVEIYGINTNFRDASTKMQELAPQKQAAADS